MEVNRIELCEERLEDRVRQALSYRTGIPVSRIMTQENKEKYYDRHNPLAPNDSLREIFGLMRSLNQMALSDPRIGSNGRGGASFATTLARITDDFAERIGSAPFHYVELGPEPVKTSFIIETLLKRGANIQSYVGVDINPASTATMNEALLRLLPAEAIQHRTVAFERFDVDAVRHDGLPALITMLGFQEGNEDPQMMGALLAKLAGADDWLLSEMQVRPAEGWQAVTAFYGNCLMKRFSRLAFSRVFADRPSESVLFIVPVAELDGEPISAAVMCEKTKDAAPGMPMLFVTNYCLKYTAVQLRRYRELYFDIGAQRLTGDGSVAFQLSRRSLR